MRTGTNVLNLLTDIKGESILNSEETILDFASEPICPHSDTSLGIWIQKSRQTAQGALNFFLKWTRQPADG